MMRLINKLLSVIITIVLFNNLIVANISANEIIENDIAGSSFEFQKLNELNLVNELTHNLSDKVNRGEFAKAIVKLFGWEDSSEYEKTYFIDVPVQSEYVNSVTILFDRGVIKDENNRCFFPDRDITFGFAAKILLNAMGYGILFAGAEEQEYFYQANNLKIFSGINKAQNATITYEDLYKLIYNSLDVAIIERNFDEEINKENGILEYYHNITRKKGIVTGNQYTTLYEARAFFDETVLEIDGIKYEANKDYNELLGYEVEYYLYDYDDDIPVIIYAEKTARNNIVTYNHREFEKITNDSIEFFTNGSNKNKKYNLDDQVNVIYNNAVLTGYGKLENVNFTKGEIKLLDRNGDNKYETIFIYDYIDIVVGRINKQNKEIYDKLSDGVFKFSDTEGVVAIYSSDGEEVDFNTLKENDVISALYREIDNGIILFGYLNEEQCYGKIESISTEDKMLSIGDKKYYYDNDTNIKIGKVGTAYLNIIGDIVYFESDVSLNDEYQYGVIYRVSDIYMEEESIIIKIFKSDATFENFYVSDKFSINGKNKKLNKTSDREEVLKLPVGAGIRYKLHDGQLKYLEFGQDESTGISDNDIGFRNKYSGESSFRYYEGMLDGRIYFNDKSVIFVIPNQEQWEKTEDFAVIKNTYMNNGYQFSGTEYSCYTYGDAEECYSPMAVFRGFKNDNYQMSTHIAVVTGKKIVYDDDEGEIVKVISVLQDKVEMEYQLTEDVANYYDILEKYDVVRFLTNTRGEIFKLILVMNSEGSGENQAIITPNADSPSDVITSCVISAAGNIQKVNNIFYTDCRIDYGTVKKIDSNHIVYSCESYENGKLKNTQYVCRTTTGTYSMVDIENGTVSSISLSEIIEQDKILVQTYCGTVRRLIVFKD